MNRALRRERKALYHYADGVKKEGPHKGLRGIVSADLRGDVSHLRGDVTDLWGDIDDCGITDEDRSRGVFINNLVEV